MRKIRGSERVAIVGPGALGSVLAASLLRAGCSVALAGAGGRTLGSVRRKGLEVFDPSGKRRLLRGFEVASRPEGPFQAVFLCAKAGGLRQALACARRLCGPETAVVPLSNGVAHLGPLRREFGRNLVAGSVFIAALREAPSKVRHAGGDSIWLAADRGNASALRAARRILRKGGWRVRSVRSAESLLWTKAALNAAINPVGALTMKTNGELAAGPAARELLLETLREALSVLRGRGIRPAFGGLPRILLQGCRATPGQRNSMSQDLLAGRRTEADEILKPFVEEARRVRRPAPLLATLYRAVKRLEKELLVR
ncbi:MAG: 2-dehydropantoate 2-reductase [Elusimicrobia bacterium]|nr:2-dehydropantoate 2-reductase [Elusimicrobiota bacterium]